MKDALLPANAEHYLRALEAALWPLASDERETILLELRGHLAGCSARGPERLAEALESLGSPEECARAFAMEGAGDTCRKAGMPGRALVPVAPPAEFARGLRSGSFGAVLRDIKATYRASGDQLWAVGALVVTVGTATNFLSYIHMLRPGALEIWPVMLVRLMMLLAAFVAAYRVILTEERNIWTLDLSSLRAALAITGIFLCVFAAAFASRAMLDVASAAPVARIVVLVLLLLGSSLFFLRLQPWVVAQAIDRRDMTLARVVAGTKGRMPAIAKGWAMIILPLALAHYATALIVGQSDTVHPLHLLLAGVDGIISMGIVIGGALLNATVFRWTAGEPIPAARPFASGEPDQRFVEQARSRLQHHIEARGGSVRSHRLGS